MFRQQLARNVRLFSTSVRVQNKGPIDAAKETLQSVDKTVSQKIVSGIEKGGKSIMPSLACRKITKAMRPQRSSPAAQRSKLPRVLRRPHERQRM